MKLVERLNLAADLLEEYLPFINQLDKNVITDYNRRFNHAWINEVMMFSDEDALRFDALRDYKLVSDKKWQNLIEQIRSLSNFPQSNFTDKKYNVLGNKKKQHELNRLFDFLDDHCSKIKSAVDFGGGVGNLAHHLEKNLSFEPIVIERDEKLIAKGKEKLRKQNSNVKFYQADIGRDIKFDFLKDKDFAIGLHTCGNFAKDMMSVSAEHKVKNIVNFGCCYSKIQNHDYHHSSYARKSLNFNQRALASATLSFGTVNKEIYNFRLKIMNYKYSFYHWLFQKTGNMEFSSMSNSRRTLYDKDFYSFVIYTLDKFYPKLEKPSKLELIDFINSEKNRKLNKYFQAYYGISRYIGEVLEVYLLCDRALYLQEKGYDTNIYQVFEHNLSPRNKAILGYRL